MSAREPINVPRLIRIATLLFAILAGALVYFSYASSADSLERRIDDAQMELRSDEVAFAEVPHLELERRALVGRYATLLVQNSQAVFLRELAATVRRHGVQLATTAVAPAAERTRSEAPRAALLSPTAMTLELRGTYRNLLAAVGELSLGSEIVRVESPSLHRDGDTIVASVPLILYEPLRRGEGTSIAGTASQR